MTFLLAFGYWLVSSVKRMMRLRKAPPPPHSVAPEWPLGASIEVCLHKLRFNGDEFSEGPPTVRMNLRRELKTGRIYDQDGRELAAAAIRTQRAVTTLWGRIYQKATMVNALNVHQDPDDILRVLGAEIFSGRVMTLVFTDMAALRRAKTPFNRVGVTCIDATSVWIESSSGFMNPHEKTAPLEAEYAAA